MYTSMHWSFFALLSKYLRACGMNSYNSWVSLVGAEDISGTVEVFNTFYHARSKNPNQITFIVWIL